MPYFIFKVFPGKRLEPIANYPSYKDAREQVKTLRGQLAAADNYAIRMLFAKNASQAEHLIATERPYEAIGEE